MKKWFWICLLFSSAALFGQTVDVHDTRLLTLPAISKDHIAFVYAGDLWIAGPEGKGVRRLTTGQIVESTPAFSSDGQWIAFAYGSPSGVGISRRDCHRPG